MFILKKVYITISYFNEQYKFLTLILYSYIFIEKSWFLTILSFALQYIEYFPKKIPNCYLYWIKLKISLQFSLSLEYIPSSVCCQNAVA